MKNFDWILFDADHTLFDFDRASEKSLQKVFEESGISWQPDYFDIYYGINKLCWRDFEEGRIDRSTLRTERFARFFEALEINGLDPETYNDRYLGNLPHFPFFLAGARELVESLHGNIKLGIITNGMKEVQRPRLQRSGIAPLFDVIVVSDEIGVAKPDPSFFQYAFDQMPDAQKHRVLVVGDSLNADIRGGRDFGFKTCWYNPASAGSQAHITPDYHLDDLAKIHELLG